MFEEIKAWFKALLGGDRVGDLPNLKGPQVKRIRGMLLLGLIGIVLLLLANTWNTSSPITPEANQSQEVTYGGETGRRTTERPVAYSQEATGERYAAKLEKDLEKALAEIDGVGQVLVRISLATGPSYDYARNEVKEERTTRDTGTNARETTEVRDSQELVVFRNDAERKEEPALAKSWLPEINGVVVVADGAMNSRVKLRITEAVITLLHIPLHKVVVLPRQT